jgi:predicted Rossmann fold nucleotide-binding protein DprA/Smf involved in DNA uptake
VKPIRDTGDLGEDVADNAAARSAFAGEPVRLTRADPGYPGKLEVWLPEPPAQLSCLGDAAILDGRGAETIALFCSASCPGTIISKTYDLAQALRRRGSLVVSGFHSPMEQECLRILLQSPNPVIVCMARGIARSRTAGC